MTTSLLACCCTSVVLIVVSIAIMFDAIKHLARWFVRIVEDIADFAFKD